MASKRKIVRVTYQLAKSWAVILLLFLYVLGSSNIESFHSLFHKYETTVLHTEQNEADPCHIALYHQKRDGGCHHDSHLVKEDKCSLCHVQLHNAQIAEVSAITLPVTFCVVSSSNSFELYIEGINFQSAGRAPPLS
jgi:hypothetical protein